MADASTDDFDAAIEEARAEVNLLAVMGACATIGGSTLCGPAASRRRPAWPGWSRRAAYDFWGREP
jgi:hypothetical protein